jgi:hypothetical protein
MEHRLVPAAATDQERDLAVRYFRLGNGAYRPNLYESPAVRPQEALQQLGDDS